VIADESLAGLFPHACVDVDVDHVAERRHDDHDRLRQCASEAVSGALECVGVVFSIWRDGAGRLDFISAAVVVFVVVVAAWQCVAGLGHRQFVVWSDHDGDLPQDLHF
jgi:hypothetical protein